MLVVLAIIVIITTIALTGQSLFNRTLILINTSYDVALSIHQAEVFGISSKTFAGSENTGYGVEFTKASPGSYVFYADLYPAPGAASNCHCNNASCSILPDAKPGDCVYDAAQNELVQQYKFGAGITVADFCGFDNTGAHAKHCAVATPSDLRALDVVYVRPNAQAIITATDNGGNQISLSQATLYLSADNAQKCVQISAVGQVSVLTACP
jgi:hypothetical protein